MSSKSRQQLEKYLNEIEIKDSKCLDIGGSQLPINGRIKHSNCEFKILDLKQPHECKQEPYFTGDLNNGAKVDTVVVFENGDEHAFLDEQPLVIIDTKQLGAVYKDITNYNKYFDIAFCIEVSEYWWNPIQALKNINYFLKKDGILYLSTHFLYPIHNPKEQDYLRYTPSGIKKMLKETGFKNLQCQARYITNGANYEHFIYTEGMKPSKDSTEHHYQGTIIKCEKA